ncbi:hypothetical protein LQZ19_17060 [Treponema primitia]|uniref:hypothetical protein n=1 Tax=Treponema primitia TaxID=88058 RepID=UPI0039810950
MADLSEILKEADELGIINIDVASGEQLSPKMIEIAVGATKLLGPKLKQNEIKVKLQKADSEYFNSR